MANNISVYTNLQVIPTVVAGGLIMIAGIVAILFSYFKKKDSFLLSITNTTFQGGFEIKTEQNKKKYLVFGHEVDRSSLLVMGWLSTAIWTILLVLFWNIFLFDTTSNCDNNLDCFAYNTSNGSLSLIRSEPIENCTDFVNEDNNIGIRCYHFVFDFTGAIGAVGGLLVIGTRFIQIHITVLYWLQNKIINSHGICKLSWKLILYVDVFTPFLAVIVAFLTTYIQNTLSNSHSLNVQFVCLVYIIVIFSYYEFYVLAKQFGCIDQFKKYLKIRETENEINNSPTEEERETEPLVT